MAWTVKYTETAQRQLKKLDRPVALRVLDDMDERIATLEDPRSQGKNLVGPKMGSYWRYRLGDVRVSCHLQEQVLLILVIEMASLQGVPALGDAFERNPLRPLILRLERLNGPL